jgi:hypothetical protein
MIIFHTIIEVSLRHHASSCCGHRKQLPDKESAENKPGRILKCTSEKSLGHVARMGQMRNVYVNLFGRTVGKRSLGRPKRKW